VTLIVMAVVIACGWYVAHCLDGKSRRDDETGVDDGWFDL
jgi:hypothetical protein